MTPKERFFATIERKPVDRLASWLGMPHQSSYKRLFDYFKVTSIRELKALIGDDLWEVDVPYNCPPSNHIACAFNFAKERAMQYETRTLTAPGFFEDYTNPSKVDEFEWPDPAAHLAAESCRKAVQSAPEGYPILGMLWSCHFQDTCAAFGMEKALMNLLQAPEMFTAVIERITEFYLSANEIFYEATLGKLDAVLIGNDFGSQRGLMVSPALIRKFVMPTQRRIVGQAKDYELKVIFHSCGSIYPIISDLIKIGVDAIHPVQVLAVNMELERLKRDFGDRISFCGGIDVQHLMVNGIPTEIRKRVQQLTKLFTTGLIISPSHEALLPDVDPANVKALFDALKS